MAKKIIIALILSSAFFIVINQTASASEAVKKPRPEFETGKVLVKYKEGLIKLDNAGGQSQASVIAQTHDLENPELLPEQNIGVYKISDGKTVAQKIQEVRANPAVEYAEPNYLYYPDSVTPDDTYYSDLWGLNNTGQSVNGTSGTSDADIDAPEAWALGHSASGVIVAVVDTGVNLNHPEFSGRLVQGYDFVDDDSAPYDLGGHGTHVAGTITARGDNADGVTGVAWDAKIMPVRVLGLEGGSNEDIAAGIDYAVEHGAKVINMSLGGTGYSQTLYDAIARARDADVLAVIAAGNDAVDNEETHHYPCDYDLANIICVAATDQDDGLASFSNWSSTSVDVAAPGTNILSTYPGAALYDNFEEAHETTIYGYDFTDTEFTVSGDIAPQGWLITDIAGNNWAESDYGGGYNNVDSYITSGSFNTSGEESLLLSFRYDFLTETSLTSDCEYDYLGIDVYNGSAWTQIGRLCNYYGDPWGESEAVGTAEYDVTEYDSSSTKVRFHWHTDASGSSYPFFLDNVGVYDTSEGYNYLNGTSMATPHVAGLTALVWAHYTGGTYADIKSLILETVDELSALSGKVVTGGRINAYAALSELDSTPPHTTYTRKPSRPNGSNGWFRTAPAIYLRATDSGSGIASIRYKWNSGTYRIYTRNFRAKEGQNTLYYHARDVAGNRETNHSKIIKVDTIKPTLRLTNSLYRNTTLSNKRTVAGTVSDSGSGLKGVYVNGVQVTVRRGAFSRQLTLREGLNNVRVAVTDIAGNKKVEIKQVYLKHGKVFTADAALDRIYATAHPGYAPQVRIFNKKGKLESQWFAYAQNVKTGVNIDSGDVNNDGKIEVVVGPAGAASPEVRVYSKKGTLLNKWHAYPLEWNIGANVAVGDVNGDAVEEIVVVPNVKARPHVKIFNRKGVLKYQFFASNEPALYNIAVGDVNGDWKEEIILASTADMRPEVKIYNRNGVLLKSFIAYAETFRGGMVVTAGDINGDHKDEIITGVAGNAPSHIRTFNSNGSLVSQFFAYALDYRGGISLADGDINLDGKDEIITGTAPGQSALVRTFKKNGSKVSEFYAFPQAWNIGVRL